MLEGQDGQISGSLFMNFVVTIDFDEGVLLLIEPHEFDGQNAGTALPMTQTRPGSYRVPCTVSAPDGRDVHLEPALDLGAIFPLWVFTPPHFDLVPGTATAESVLGVGASGPIRGRTASLPVLALGDRVLRNVPVAFTSAAPRMGRDGVLGLPALRRFRVTFDYFRQQLYLEPGRSYAEDFEPLATPE
jgi:hypothetical protein